MKTKSAEELKRGEDIMLVIDGQRCDVTVDLVLPSASGKISVSYHTRGVPDAYKKTIFLARFHSVQILRSL